MTTQTPEIRKVQKPEWKVPLFKIQVNDSDVAKVTEVLKRGSFWADGPEVKEFEKKLAEFHNAKYALTFNSGTSALVAMYEGVNVKGKEVIVPSFTFIATANAILLAGGIPVFAETEEETLGLDAEDVAKKITDKTAAIVNLNYAGGVSRDAEKLAVLAKEKGILFLEDNAHSLGVRKQGKLCGMYGDASILSFCQNKLITTGEGGAVITNNTEMYERMKLFRSHGRVENADGDYFASIADNEYIEAGHNFRMPTMNAALGLSQLENYAKTMQLRKQAGEYLSWHLSEIKGVKVPEWHFANDAEHYYQMYTITLENQATRDSLQAFLKKKRVMSRVYYAPIHLKDLYVKRFGYKLGDLPQTERIASRVLTLPMYPGMPKEEMDHVINAIKDFFGGRV